MKDLTHNNDPTHERTTTLADEELGRYFTQDGVLWYRYLDRDGDHNKIVVPQDDKTCKDKW